VEVAVVKEEEKFRHRSEYFKMVFRFESIGDEELVFLPLLLVSIAPFLLVHSVFCTQARGGQL
jgi:hypothetical protein